MPDAATSDLAESMKMPQNAMSAGQRSFGKEYMFISSCAGFCGSSCKISLEEPDLVKLISGNRNHHGSHDDAIQELRANIAHLVANSIAFDDLTKFIPLT